MALSILLHGTSTTGFGTETASPCLSFSEESDTSSSFSEDSVEWSPSVTNYGTHSPKPKRISFSTESLVLFSIEESPRQIAQEQYHRKSIEDISTLHLKRSEPTASANTPQPPRSRQPPWSIISSTAPSPLSPVNELLQSTPVALESIRLITSTTSPAKLILSILVRNETFEKHVSCVYTFDAWTTPQTSSSGNFISHTTLTHPRTPQHGNTPQLDRFVIEILCPHPSSSGCMQIEFAVKCVMHGVESWDNRLGKNHFVTLKHSNESNDSYGSQYTNESNNLNDDAYFTPRRTRSALDLEAEERMKRRASMLALRVGAAVANEAKKIDDEFVKDWRRRSSDNVATVSASSADKTVDLFKKPVFTIAPRKFGPAITPHDYLSVEDKPLRRGVTMSVDHLAAQMSHFLALPTLQESVGAQQTIGSVDKVAAAVSALEEEERVTALSEREAEYANKMMASSTPLRPLRRMDSVTDLVFAASDGSGKVSGPRSASPQLQHQYQQQIQQREQQQQPGRNTRIAIVNSGHRRLANKFSFEDDLPEGPAGVMFASVYPG
ncbi:hypothetical protein HDU81_007099 [Chytriomyces hyalinus]|nr:hypothetical protein HDU81_007099 [Chytriomyces hyalinus]